MPAPLVPVAFALAPAWLGTGELPGDSPLELFALSNAPAAAAAAMLEDREWLTAGEDGGRGGRLATVSGDMGDADAELLTGLALPPALAGDGIGVAAAAGLAVLLAEADPSVAGAARPAAVLLTGMDSGEVSSEAPALAFAAVRPLTEGES